MASTFVSGQLRLRVAYSDRSDQYKVRICPTIKGEPCETVSVNPPRAGSRSAHGRRIGVDDPRAMLSAARAAISFSRLSELADYSDSGVRVRPPKRRRRSRR